MIGRVNGLYHKAIVSDPKYPNRPPKVLYRILVQTPRPAINCLALEGGGSACAALAGFFKVMEELGLLAEIDEISCISGGTLAGLFLALGFSAEEISDALLTMPASEFVVIPESWSITPEIIAKIRKMLSAAFVI